MKEKIHSIQLRLIRRAFFSSSLIFPVSFQLLLLLFFIIQILLNVLGSSFFLILIYCCMCARAGAYVQK